jgi:hypothetical protein
MMHNQELKIALENNTECLAFSKAYQRAQEAQERNISVDQKYCQKMRISLEGFWSQEGKSIR